MRVERGSEMSIWCFGLNHQTAAVNVRERFAIPQSALPEALARLKTMPGLTEGLIVSTCNRTEFYVTGELGHLGSGFFRELLSRFPTRGRSSSVPLMG